MRKAVCDFVKLRDGVMTAAELRHVMAVTYRRRPTRSSDKPPISAPTMAPTLTIEPKSEFWSCVRPSPRPPLFGSSNL